MFIVLLSLLNVTCFNPPEPFIINPLYSGNPLIGTLTNSEDRDEMQHNESYESFSS